MFLYSQQYCTYIGALHRMLTFVWNFFKQLMSVLLSHGSWMAEELILLNSDHMPQLTWSYAPPPIAHRVLGLHYIYPSPDFLVMFVITSISLVVMTGLTNLLKLTINTSNPNSLSQLSVWSYPP